MSRRILVVRLGAMGDIVHTLPAVASLKHSIPDASITWVVESRWAELLSGNPHLDRVIPVDRSTVASLAACWKQLRADHYDIAVDFQGLLKSAVVASFAHATNLYGFARSRERIAALLYSQRVPTAAVHKVEQNLDLSAGAGGTERLLAFSIPAGHPEGELPENEFVLASPAAGWGAKQWPLDYYAELGAMLCRERNMTLVLNGPARIEIPNTAAHVSGIAGLIDATRRASAVLGLDSGPLHIADALGKPGVAIYGPTDPAINGPYGKTIAVLRAPGAQTTYKRRREPAPSMRAISPRQVLDTLRAVLDRTAPGTAVRGR